MPATIRRDLAGRHGHRRLVAQCEPLDYMATADEHLALHVQRERRQVGIVEALRGRRGVARNHRALRVVARRLAPERDRQPQVALHDALLRLSFDEPLRAADPAGPATHLPGESSSCIPIQNAHRAAGCASPLSRCA